MCTFFNSLPKKSHSVGNNKKRNLALTLKPCPDDKTYYRFRILGFSSSGKNDRDYPFIKRFVHQKWGVNPEKGYPVLLDEITCPVTPHVHIEGNRYNACKMCEVSNKYFLACKESGWKDREASKKNKEFGRKFQGIVPVYVISDPNYEGNENKFKVIIFNEKEIYQDFCDKVEKYSQKFCVFNGKNAVDCCIHVSEVSEIKNEGQPNEYKWTHKVIDKITFSNKPYDIPSITKETCDAMGFDDEYFTTSTNEEILAFYNKYCKVSNDDIPEDDSEIPIYDKPEQKVVVKNNSISESPSQNMNIENNNLNEDLDSLVDDLTVDSDNKDLMTSLELESKNNNEVKENLNEQQTNDATDKDVDDLLAGLDI